MTTAIVWLRRDLRLDDNPALHAACAECEQVVPLYVHQPEPDAPWTPGAASRWWLHHALQSLDEDLASQGSRLIVRNGDPLTVLRELCEQSKATHLYWNRLYDPTTLPRDEAIKSWARHQGLHVESFNGYLLHEPWTVQNGKGDPYRVFTPYWKSIRSREPAACLPIPSRFSAVNAGIKGLSINDLQLLPTIAWDSGLAERWTPGENGARSMLTSFLDANAETYDQGRDIPGATSTSRLSPHLHFGEISARRVLRACSEQPDSDGLSAYVRQLYWREFAHHQLFHFPDTPEQALDPRFREFPWPADQQGNLRRWQQGETGIPVVDAGMRELWHSGWMHNRVRMIAGSLLTKNLLIPWQAGAHWFWDTLVDANLANNTLGWQWVAGCGADAAPYFRIFNPVTQGERFDAQGDYVRRWVPELQALPDKWLHRPWEAPTPILQQAGVTLGHDYPKPIVDLKTSRKRALAIWDDIKHRAR